VYVHSKHSQHFVGLVRQSAAFAAAPYCLLIHHTGFKCILAAGTRSSCDAHATHACMFPEVSMHLQYKDILYVMIALRRIAKTTAGVLSNCHMSACLAYAVLWRA
jgi:hypothetical protein